MAGTTLGTAYVQIVPSAQGIKGSITNTLSGEAEAAGTSVGTGIGAFAKKALVAAGVGAALVKVVKGAMDEGGKLQQSYLGGLDTLYGEAADSARAYAREAAKAGISMNTYSEQAVSFGAALKNAYGGDVVKAAEAANTAILDMADNSAKMGTDIQSVQNAYQGFAKQNYTMLDNLKLGYGGTKTEMERLLKDAEALTGVKYDINNLGDVYEAIHAIQGELGLTGVAAGEAEGTFTGSMGAMRAAAQNFLGSLALGEDVTNSLNIMVTSASTFFFKNLLPMLGTILKSLPSAIFTFIKQGAPILLENISALVASLATSLKAKADAVSGEQVTAWIGSTVPKLLSAAGALIKAFGQGLIKNLPTIVSSIGKIGGAIVSGLGTALYGKVSAAAANIRDKFMQPINSIKDKVSAAIQKVKNLFPISIGRIMSNIKLPHFSISGKFGLNPPQTPKLSIDWYAKGGIVNSATLIGAGERGAEAILPLDPFWKKLDQMNSRTGDVTINVYASEGMDVKAVAREVRNELIATENRRRLAWQ